MFGKPLKYLYALITFRTYTVYAALYSKQKKKQNKGLNILLLLYIPSGKRIYMCGFKKKKKKPEMCTIKYAFTCETSLLYVHLKYALLNLKYSWDGVYWKKKNEIKKMIIFKRKRIR